MNKLLPLTLLSLVVAVSGCTSQVATQENLDSQTREINQHTRDVVKDANKPVTKYNITTIDVEATCSARGDYGDLTAVSSAKVQLFEWDSGIQSFDNRKTLILNGIKEIDTEVYCQNQSHEEDSLHLFDVQYEKSVYQNGTRIASASNECEIHEDVDLRDEPFVEHDFAESMAEQIYDQCFGVKYRGDEH